MRNFVFLIGLLLGVISCDGIDRPKKPDNLIPKEKMEAILHDVYILNAAKGTNRKALIDNGVDPERYIFDKYGVDSLQFALSNDYYAFDIKAYEAIVDSVKKRLEVSKSNYDSLMNVDNAIEKKASDSFSRRYNSKAKALQERDTVLKN